MKKKVLFLFNNNIFRNKLYSIIELNFFLIIIFVLKLLDSLKYSKLLNTWL
jgi:hypothetical protein